MPYNIAIARYETSGIRGRASEFTPINGTYQWAIRFGPPASLVGCDGGWVMQGGDTEVGEETVRLLANTFELVVGRY
jgi:hypothetical protein